MNAYFYWPYLHACFDTWNLPIHHCKKLKRINKKIPSLTTYFTFNWHIIYSVCVRVLPLWQIMSSWSSLCAQRHCHAGTCCGFLLCVRRNCNEQKHTIQLCASSFGAKDWGRIRYGCDGQVGTNLWSCSVHCQSPPYRQHTWNCTSLTRQT